MAEAKLVKVSGFVVGRAGFPAAIHDALPFECQGAQGAMVSGSASSQHTIVSLGPERFFPRVVGVLVKGLGQELGTGQAAVHGARFAAASEHRGGGETLAIAEKARRHSGEASAGRPITVQVRASRYSDPT